MPNEQIKIGKGHFVNSELAGLLTDDILKAIAAAETGNEVVLTVDQAIAVAQVAATLRVANAISNAMNAMLDEQIFPR